MLFVASLPLALGLAGLAWSTVAAPFFGVALAALLGRRRAPIFVGEPRPLQFEVLIAAHNEEAVLARTLESVVAAASRLRADGVRVTVTVGCDHCTDGTRGLVERFAAGAPIAVRALENNGERGKWNVLKLLIGQSRADWVALVDAASIWNPALLERAWPMVLDPEVIGVAPSYSPRRSGGLERANWKLEQFLKRLENQAGGPVSVHGASVLYRRETLALAMAELEGTDWLNDDVAIPLTLRLQNPASRLVYLSEGVEGGWVTDIGVKSELGVEYRRRRRMLIGNLQWVKLILFRQWSRDLVITAIASRRFFRMLWAYWVLLIGVGAGSLLALIATGLMASQNINTTLTCAILISAVFGLLAASNWTRRLLMAFISGLQLPRYWKQFSNNRGVVWL